MKSQRQKEDRVRACDSRTSAFHILPDCLSRVFWVSILPHLQEPQAKVLWEIALFRLWSCSHPRGEAKIIHKTGYLHLFQVPAALFFLLRRNYWFLSSRCCPSWICFFHHSVKLCIFGTVRNKGLEKSNPCWPVSAGLQCTSRSRHMVDGSSHMEFTSQRITFYQITIILLDFSPNQPIGGWLSFSILWQARWMQAVPTIRLDFGNSHSKIWKDHWW